MNLREWLAERPAGVRTLTLDADELAKALDDLAEPEAVSTSQASKLLGHSRKFWERQASKIDGAYKTNGDGNWCLPLAACRAHLLRLKNQQRRGGLRGPRRAGPGKAAAA